MISRTEEGNLKLNSLDIELLIDGLFDECKTVKEVNWIEEQLQPIIECIAEERINELEEEN